jgi:phosphohistidine phosphatase
MRSLYLLRHAKSSWAEPGLADRDRPLAPRGRRDAKRMAKHLRRLGFAPEFVLCSPVARTCETLELISPALDASTVVFEEDLYAASSDALLARIRRVPDGVASVMLVGHNPGLHQLALALASRGHERGRLEAKFPTAALASLAVPKPWGRLEPGDAALSAYVVPKQLK